MYFCGWDKQKNGYNFFPTLKHLNTYIQIYGVLSSLSTRLLDYREHNFLVKAFICFQVQQMKLCLLRNKPVLSCLAEKCGINSMYIFCSHTLTFTFSLFPKTQQLALYESGAARSKPHNLPWLFLSNHSGAYKLFCTEEKSLGFLTLSWWPLG